jgi:hypothetical protein
MPKLRLCIGQLEPAVVKALGMSIRAKPQRNSNSNSNSNNNNSNNNNSNNSNNSNSNNSTTTMSKQVQHSPCIQVLATLCLAPMVSVQRARNTNNIHNITLLRNAIHYNHSITSTLINNINPSITNKYHPPHHISKMQVVIQMMLHTRCVTSGGGGGGGG